MSTLARTMKATTVKSNMKDKIRSAMQYLQKIRGLMQEVNSIHVWPTNIQIWSNFILRVYKFF